MMRNGATYVIDSWQITPSAHAARKRPSLTISCGGAMAAATMKAI
jgi:hypothetical protein